ncbi:MAG: metal-dependent transcriptional regulator [Sphaerochaetaceae bacterium]
MRESGEDYLEAVLALSEKEENVRLTDVAKALNVTKPSASRAMKNLQLEGYIHQESYGTIELTEKGRRKANQIYGRHKMLTTFLNEVLGLDADIAEADACRMEHILSSETIEKFATFVEKHKEKDPVA